MDATGTRAYYATVAPYYDTELAARGDLDFWLDLAGTWRPGQTVDYGCGTGRITVPLALRCARWGGEVTGLDLSPDMLRRARQRWQGSRHDTPASALHLRVGDMRRMALGHAIDLVLFADDPLTHLANEADFAATFRRVREQLRPGGRIVVEASLLPPEARGETKPVVLHNRFSVRSPDGVIDVEQERHIVPAACRADVIYRYRMPAAGRSGGPAMTEARFVAHYLDPPTLEALFRLAGCRLEERWGGFRFQALTDESPMLLCTGRKLY